MLEKDIKRDGLVITEELLYERGEEILLEMLTKMAMRKVEKKKWHRTKQIDYEQALVTIKI